MSLVEAGANVALGYVLAVLAQLILFPVLGLQPTVAQSLRIGLLFTVISLARSFVLRRVFDRIAGQPGSPR